MKADSIDDQMAFAKGRVQNTEGALNDQIALISFLKRENIDFTVAVERLERLNKELSEWRSFLNMVRIKYEMLKTDRRSAID